MRWHRVAGGLVAGWLLAYSGDPARPIAEWDVLDVLPSRYTCDQVRDHEVEREALAKIGGALARQTADNPLRAQAFGRAVRIVRERYRCVPQR